MTSANAIWKMCAVLTIERIKHLNGCTYFYCIT